MKNIKFNNSEYKVVTSIMELPYKTLKELYKKEIKDEVEVASILMGIDKDIIKSNKDLKGWGEVLDYISNFDFNLNTDFSSGFKPINLELDNLIFDKNDLGLLDIGTFEYCRTLLAKVDMTNTLDFIDVSFEMFLNYVEVVFEKELISKKEKDASFDISNHLKDNIKVIDLVMFGSFFLSRINQLMISMKPEYSKLMYQMNMMVYIRVLVSRIYKKVLGFFTF